MIVAIVIGFAYVVLAYSINSCLLWYQYQKDRWFLTPDMVGFMVLGWLVSPISFPFILLAWAIYGLGLLAEKVIESFDGTDEDDSED